MRRRAYLRGVAAVGGLAAPVGGAGSPVGRAAGDTATGDDESYEPIGRVAVEGAAEAVVGDDGTVYLAATDGFVTVDVSDPADPVVLAEVRDVGTGHEDGPLTSILDVKVDGDRLLVSGPARKGTLKGLVVYDVSDPSAPTPATEFVEWDAAIHNAYFADGYAYLTDYRSERFPLAVVDVSTGREVGRWSPLDADVGVDGWADRSRMPGQIHDVYVHDGVAYCAYWDAGVWMVDVSDPATPEYVGRVGDYSLAEVLENAGDEASAESRFVEAPGNAHYVAVDDAGELMAVGAEAWDRRETDGGGPGGIDLYDLSNRRNPEKLATIDPESAPNTTRQGTWTTAHNFDLRDGRLYSAWYEAGVKVHDVSEPSDPQRLAWWRDPARTLFWTAQRVGSGDFFVASSHDRYGHWGGLYAFPDRAGSQTDPPPLSRGTGNLTTEGATTTSDGDARGMGGFGALTALAGLGVGAGAYRRLRDARE